MQRGTFKLMKSLNTSLIINKIRTCEPISRAQIAKEVELTPPTVSSIVRELIKEGLVKESVLGESQGGRKPTMLLINKNRFYVIGVDAGPRTVECIVSNLLGEVQNKLVVSIDKQLTNESFLNLLKVSIKKMIETVVDAGSIIGIGVAMHGVVNVKEGISLFAPILQLSNIPIKEELEQEFNLTVRVENDARSMVFGESWFGGHKDISSMLALNLGAGVGAGIVIDENLYHGATDLAGEVGHMTINMYGERCTCGNRGCFESYVSAPAIVRRANEIMPNQDVTSSEQVYKLAKQGDLKSIGVLEETGVIIGIGLMNLVHIINPELIILGGGVSQAKEFILGPIKKTIAERGLTNEAKETNVIVSQLGSDATILGAVALLLVELFKPE